MYKFILLNNPKYLKFQSSYNESDKNYIQYSSNSKIIILLLLIAYYSLLDSYNLNLNTYEQKLYNYTMNNYTLYHLSKFPKLSIIILDLEKEEKLLNFTKHLINQTLTDIQIIYIWKNRKEKNNFKKIKNYSLIDKRISIFESYTNLEKNIFKLMEKIKGKFTLLIDNIINFSENQLENLYNITKGKINNIFETIVESTKLYLIKTKILYNLLDEGHFVFNFNKLINLIKSKSLPNLNYISIAFCPNNDYTPLTYVAMISVLKSKSCNTYISFYLITPDNYKSTNEDFIFSLYDQFDFFNITFIKMDNRYKNAYISRRMSLQTYYRFSLGELLPNINKIIYLDGDVIVYKDLSNLYDLNFNGKFVLGQVTGNNRNKRTGVYRINNGILLFNLHNMRKFKIEKKALEIIKMGKHLFYHDQTLMNDYFKYYIGIFQLEYHIRNWDNISSIQRFNKGSGKVYDNDVFYFSTKYPSIRHFLGKYKPTLVDRGHTEDWWYFARQSKFYITKSHDVKKIFNFSFT